MTSCLRILTQLFILIQKMTSKARYSFCPPLRVLLSNIIKGKDCDLKIASLGQAIIQAARPKTCIARLQINVGVKTI